MQFKEDLLNKAYLFAEEKHRNQRYGDKDFIYHLLQTYKILSFLCPEDKPLLTAGFLHDLQEDQRVTKEEIEKEFGIEVAELVNEVTATKRNYFPNLKTIRGVILLTASRLCNMTNMDDWSEEKKQEYVFKKTKYWLP